MLEAALAEAACAAASGRGGATGEYQDSETEGEDSAQPLLIAVACRLRLDRLLGGLLRLSLASPVAPCPVVRWPDYDGFEAAELDQRLRDDFFLQRSLGCVPLPVGAGMTNTSMNVKY